MGRIVTACDENFWPALKALFNSYKQNSSRGFEFVAMIFGSSEFAQQVRDYGIEVVHNPVLDGAKHFPYADQWTEEMPVMYSRLWVPNIFNDGVRNIWVDADSLILWPLDELLRLEFNDPVASTVARGTIRQSAQGYKGPWKDCEVLASGLLVYNNDAYGKNNILNRCLRLMNENRHTFKHVVQSVLAIALHDNWLRLPYEWQVYGNRRTFVDWLERAKIVHYIGPYKPWLPMPEDPGLAYLAYSRHLWSNYS